MREWFGYFGPMYNYVMRYIMTPTIYITVLQNVSKISVSSVSVAKEKFILFSKEYAIVYINTHIKTKSKTIHMPVGL